MARAIHQEFNPDAIEHFSIDCDPYGVMVDRNGTIETVYIDESDYTSKKIDSILDKNYCDVQPDMTLYKKAFVLPNCPVSTDRIKAALKEHSISITKDLDAADVIISHGYLCTTTDTCENINHNYLLNVIYNHDSIDTGCMEVDDYCAANARGNELARVIYCSKVEEGFVGNYSANRLEFPYDAHMISGLAVNAAYAVEMGKPIFDVEKVMHQSATKVKLDDRLLQDIISMKNSGSGDDWNMIGAILPTIDYRYNHHLLWKLSSELYSCMYMYNRNKDVQYWKRASCIDGYYHRSALDQIHWMEEQKVLNKESFKYLESIVRKEIRIDNRDLYVFKVSVKPEYKKYLK